VCACVCVSLSIYALVCLCAIVHAHLHLPEGCAQKTCLALVSAAPWPARHKEKRCSMNEWVGHFFIFFERMVTCKAQRSGAVWTRDRAFSLFFLLWEDGLDLQGHKKAIQYEREVLWCFRFPPYFYIFIVLFRRNWFCLSRVLTAFFCGTFSVVHLTLDGVNGKWRWRRNLSNWRWK